jgi:hypothetical protein
MLLLFSLRMMPQSRMQAVMLLVLWALHHWCTSLLAHNMSLAGLSAGLLWNAILDAIPVVILLLLNVLQVILLLLMQLLCHCYLSAHASHPC